MSLSLTSRSTHWLSGISTPGLGTGRISSVAPENVSSLNIVPAPRFGSLRSRRPSDSSLADHLGGFLRPRIRMTFSGVSSSGIVALFLRPPDDHIAAIVGIATAQRLGRLLPHLIGVIVGPDD